MKKSTQKLVPALENALDILEYLSLTETSDTVKNLSETLKIPQASCFRIVNTLVKRGYLQKTQPGYVQLGPRNALLHKAFLTRNEIRQTAEPYTKQLSELTNLTVELSSYDGHEITFIDVLDSPRPITVKFNRRVGIPLIGSTNPITLVVLAHLSDEERKEVLARMSVLREVLLNLEPWLQQFPFSPEIDVQNLMATKEAGFAADFGQQTPEVTRIVAPFFDVNGSVLGTIGVAGPVFYLPSDDSDHVIEAVKTVARSLSQEFGNST